MGKIKASIKGINRAKLTNNAEFIECQELINMRHKNGKWIGVKGKKVFNEDSNLVLVHNTNIGKNFIFFQRMTGHINFVNENDPEQNVVGISGLSYSAFQFKDVRFVQMGNFIVTFNDTDKVTKYILWDIEVNGYRYIGDPLPVPLELNFHCLQDGDSNTLPASFTTITNALENGSVIQGLDYGTDSGIPVGLCDYESSSKERYEKIMAILQVAYNNWGKAGLINGYVMIRYAYELFDGSIVCHSQPTLMHIKGILTDKYSNSDRMNISVYSSTDRVYLAVDSARLQYSIPEINSTLISQLQTKYKGVIKGVNVYMSKVYHRFNDYNVKLDSVYARRNGGATPPEVWVPLDGIPQDEQITADLIIKDSLLYKVLSIPLDKLTVLTPRNLELGDVTILHTKEEMPTEQIAGNRIFPYTSYVYNSRLWMGNIINLFSQWRKPDTLNNGADYSGSFSKTIWFEYILSTAHGNIHIRSESFTSGDTHLNLPLCLYYPDARAIKFNILFRSNLAEEGVTNPTVIAFSADMTPHPTFNFSYCLMGDQPDLTDPIPVTTTTTSGIRTRTTDDKRTSKLNVTEQVIWKYPTAWASLPVASSSFTTFLQDENRVQASEVNNPLFMMAKNSYRLGNGTVKMITSNTKPLSALQYGQHPLIVFTDEGIYALELAGGEILVQRSFPISNDVITSFNCATFNGSIIFGTKRGLMSLSGDKLTRISEDIEGSVSNQVDSKDHFTWLLSDIGLVSANLSQVDFLEYINSSNANWKAILAIDYTNNELIVSNPNYSYCYVLSLESGVWSKRSERFLRIINDWPNTYAFRDNNGEVLVNLCEEDETILLPTLLISRPCGFGSTNMKRIDRTVLRCSIQGNSEPAPLEGDPDVLKRVTAFMFGLLKDKGVIFLNSGKSKYLAEVEDFYIMKSYRSSRYTVLVFGCNPDYIEFDRVDVDLDETWKV